MTSLSNLVTRFFLVSSSCKILFLLLTLCCLNIQIYSQFSFDLTDRLVSEMDHPTLLLILIQGVDNSSLLVVIRWNSSNYFSTFYSACNKNRLFPDEHVNPKLISSTKLCYITLQVCEGQVI